jgi:tetratricopeptide (TPR) repeat protein
MYNRAIEIALKERSRYIELGDIYLKKNEPDKALAAWNRMTQPDTKDASAWADLSAILKANCYYSESLSAIEEAIRLSPDDYKYLFDKAGILLLLKKA